MGWYVFLMLAAGALTPQRTCATSVTTLELPQLVQQAEVIAEVTVTNVQPYWASPVGAKAIHTRVTFQLNRAPLKGQVSSPFFLDFLGGVVGNRATKVAGMPEPHVGDRLILFSFEPDKIFASPIVGFDQGIMRVLRNERDNVDRVYRWWGTAG
jgi:hypothetical protein